MAKRGETGAVRIAELLMWISWYRMVQHTLCAFIRAVNSHPECGRYSVQEFARFRGLRANPGLG